MTEAEWGTCTDPNPILKFLDEHLNHPSGQLVRRRTERLFACACCRRIWRVLNERSRQLVDLAERYAEGHLNRAGFLDGVMRVYGLPQRPTAADLKRGLMGYLDRQRVEATGKDEDSISSAAYCAVDLRPSSAASNAVWEFTEYLRRQGLPAESIPQVWENQRAAQASLVRDISGNPFHPVNHDDPPWHTTTVRLLTESIYEERSFDRLPILADALEDAGCGNKDILSHCRSGGEHVRGCWVVDLLTGRECRTGKRPRRSARSGSA